MIGASVIASASGTVQGPRRGQEGSEDFGEEGAGSVSTRVTVYEHGKKADNPE